MDGSLPPSPAKPCSNCGAPRITVADVIRATCDVSGLTRGELTGHRRPRRLTVWRQRAMYVAYVAANASLNQVALQFDNRHHTTVLWAVRAVGDRLADPATLDAVARITAFAAEHAAVPNWRRLHVDPWSSLVETPRQLAAADQ